MVTLPEPGLVRRELLRDDAFAVVHGSRWTETARYADVALSAATYPEKDDVVMPYSRGHVMTSKEGGGAAGRGQGRDLGDAGAR